jgi:ABC-type nitrate/sulfonate/bicarbonate transport system permease component
VTTVATIERQRIALSTSLRGLVVSRVRLAQVVILAVVLAVWEVAGRRLGTFFLAPPSTLWAAAREMVASGELQHALLDSLSSLAVGFATAAVVGIVVGFLMGWYRPLGQVLNPYVSAGYVIPTAGLVPVFIIWFGLGFTARTVTVLLFCVFEILISTYTGVRNVDTALVNAARAFGANRRQLFSQVVSRASLPYIFAGLRMGASRAVKGMVIAEILFAVTGLGGVIQSAANYYRTDKVFVVVIVLAVIGIAFAALIQWLERLVTPWSDQQVS